MELQISHLHSSVTPQVEITLGQYQRRRATLSINRVPAEQDRNAEQPVVR